jgi:DNA-binding transcriptional LysR family regulator
MELHQIRYFLELCEELNFTRAAERCRVAQSSLTRAIKALEQELGGALFHRERANTHLSKLGQKVKPFLEQAYGHVEGARKQAQDFVRAQTATLRLGLMNTVAPSRLCELVAALRACHPGIALQIADATARTLQERLLGGDLDAAIYALPEIASDATVSVLPLYREPFVIAVRPAHRLARRDVVRVSDLSGEPYLRRTHCEYDAVTRETFARHGVNGPTVYQSDRDDWILAMAAAGLGYGLMPAFSADYPGVVALPLVEQIARDIVLVTVRGRPDSAGVAALVREVMRMRWISAQSLAPAMAAEARSGESSPAASVEPPDIATGNVAADQAFAQSEIPRVESRIGKQPIIQMRDAAAEALARQPASHLQTQRRPS